MAQSKIKNEIPKMTISTPTFNGNYVSENNLKSIRFGSVVCLTGWIKTIQTPAFTTVVTQLYNHRPLHPISIMTNTGKWLFLDTAGILAPQVELPAGLHYFTVTYLVSRDVYLD